MDSAKERNDIDLHDVLKERVETGEPIYINGVTTSTIEATIEGLARETGKRVQVVQFVAHADASPLRNASADETDALLRNANVKIAFND